MMIVIRVTGGVAQLVEYLPSKKPGAGFPVLHKTESRNGRL